MASFLPASNTAPADWISAGLRGFGESVLSLVPAAFPSYVRVFHPAYRLVGGRSVHVRWSEIATANGTRVHPGMQFEALDGQQAAGIQSPPDRGLPDELAEPLVEALRPYTTTPDRCWFATWDGYGHLDHDVLRAPVFEIPHRVYHLLRGPIESVVELLDNPLPNLWWPDDHAWCVASEIDLDSTYIGCGEACSDAILGRPELEALPIEPATGISIDSDLENPAPLR